MCVCQLLVSLSESVCVSLVWCDWLVRDCCVSVGVIGQSEVSVNVSVGVIG